MRHNGSIDNHNYFSQNYNQDCHLRIFYITIIPNDSNVVLLKQEQKDCVLSHRVFIEQPQSSREMFGFTTVQL